MNDDLLAQAATLIARRSLNLKPDETVALVTDVRLEPSVREILLHELSRTGANTKNIVVSFDTGNVAVELPDPDLLQGVDAVLAASTQSFTYNRHIAQVRKEGGRVISMPRITRAILERFAETDWDASLAHKDHITSQIYAASSTLELRSESGTELRVDIKNAGIQVNDGIAGPGELDQVPTGTVNIVGSNANGVIVVDGPVSHLERLEFPISLHIENSVIIEIEGGTSAEKLSTVFDQFDERDTARHCPAEIGIGTNPSIHCDLSGPFIPECARLLGMIHVGYGDDHLFPGGSVVAPIHGDFLLPNAEIWLDGNRLDLG